jgi:hypothetical protein
LTEAINKVEAIKDFYRTSYQDVFTSKGNAIDQAIEELKTVARLTTFPEMEVTWNTYLSNAGHLESPGCFRCHGKLAAISGEKAGTVIEASCDSCHYTLVAE